MSILLDLPPELKAVGDAVVALVADLQTHLGALRGAPTTDYAAVEHAVTASLAKIEQASHQGLLAALDIDAPHVLIGGRLHTRVGRYPAPYYTHAGSVDVERSIYRPADDPTARTVDPVSLRAGIVADGWLPGTATSIAFLMQQGTCREAHATAQQLGCLPYATASFDRVGHAVGGLAVRQQAPTEQTLIEAYQVPAAARSLSISLDRISVRMEEPKPRPRGRPRKGAPKRSIQCVWHMAYVATITVHDAAGEALHTLRYGRMPEDGPETLCEGLCDDVLTLLRQRPELVLVGLCDGAAELWNLLDDHLRAEVLGRSLRHLVDLWHLLEKLGTAARVRYDAAAAKAVVEGWRLRLLNSSRAAAAIEAEITQWGLADVQIGEARPVHEALTFLANQGAAGRLDYAAARRLGLPVGSGNVEATGKSLVGVRMKRPGARWHTATGEHIVTLRAWALSDRWDAALQLTLAPLRKEVKAAA